MIQKKETDEWLLPKGGIKPGESKQEAALREVREETGFVDIKLLFPEVIETVKWRKGNYEKTVYYFPLIAKTLRKTANSQIANENFSGRWFDFEEALKTLTFAEAKEVVAKYKYYLCLYEVKEMLIKHPEVVSVCVCGSMACGTIIPGWSDIDVVVVVNRLDSLLYQFFREVLAATEGYGIRTSIFPIEKEEISQGRAFQLDGKIRDAIFLNQFKVIAGGKIKPPKITKQVMRKLALLNLLALEMFVRKC